MWTPRAQSWGAKGGKPATGPQAKPLAAAAVAQAQKRGISPGAPVQQKPASGTKAAYKVTSKFTDVKHKTLVGDFAEQGSNHGKKYYKKVQKIPGHESTNVFLYYWDNRDGADFSGWYFGDQLGGQLVWARANNHGPTPPKAGWCIPWDSKKPEPGALTVDLVGGAVTPGQPAARAGSAPPANSAAALAKVKKAAGLVEVAEGATNRAVASGKKTAENKTATVAMFTKAVEELQTQQKKLKEAQASVTQEGANKAGWSAVMLADFAKLPTKLKSLEASLNAQLSQLRNLQNKATSEIKRAEEEKKNKVQAEKETKEFKVVLPKIKDEITKAEDEVDKAAKEANPLVASPPEEGEALTKQLESVESLAVAAQKQITEARNLLNAKMADARKYVAASKAEALKELNELSTKIADAQKKANSYKTFKKDFSNRVAAKKALAEVEEKLASAQPNITKATGMCTSTSYSSDEVVEVDKLIVPAKEAVHAALATINQKYKGADGATQTELDALRTRGTDLKKKLSEIDAKLKVSRQAVDINKALVDADEKVAQVKSAWKSCQEAEMPFLKGMEVLPKEESDPALAAADKAISEATTGGSSTKAFLRKHIDSSKSYPAELGKEVNDKFKPLLAELEALDRKVSEFRKETAERKTAAWLYENGAHVDDAEKKVTACSEAAAIFKADKLEESTVDAIKAAREAMVPLAKDAHTAISDARKTLSKGAKGPGLQKLMVRLDAVNSKLTKEEQSVRSGDQFLKAKAAFDTENEKLNQAEKDADKVVSMAPAEGATMTEETVKSMDEAVTAVLKVLQQVAPAVQAHVGPAPPKLKAELQKLLERKSKAQESVNKAKAAAKGPREQVLSEVYINEATRVAASVDAALEKMNAAELPYLKGIEVLPLKESQDAIAASEKAITDAKEATSLFQKTTSGHVRSMQSFADTVVKSVKKSFAELTEKVNGSGKTVAEFQKATAERKKAALVQEAGVKVDELDAELKKVLATTEPFAKDEAKEWTEAAAEAPLATFLAAEKDFSTKMTETRTLVNQAQGGAKGNSAHMESTKKLSARLGEASAELAKARKPIAVHEDKFRGKTMLADATASIATLAAKLKTATDACAPLLEKGGEDYLVTTSVAVLAQALMDHAKEKSSDDEAVYKEASGGKKLSETKFVAYVAGLAAAIGHEEINFTEERRAAVFKSLDVDKDGFVSKEEFKGMFKQRGQVKKELSVTDGFSIADSKTVGKVVPNEVVELFGVPKEDADKMVRTQCKLKDDTVCWISIKQGSNTFVHASSNAFGDFCKGIEAAVAAGEANVRKITADLEAKIKQAGSSTSEPLKTAKEELVKLRTQCTTATADLKTLRNKVNAGKDAVKTKERAEKNAHIEAKEIKEAQEIFGAATPKVAEAEAAAAAVEEKAKLFVDAEDAEKFATPATILDEVEKLVAVAKTKAEEARVVAKEQMQVATKVTPQTAASARAKREIQQYLQQLDKLGGKANGVLRKVSALCDKIVKACVEKVSTALRAECSKSGVDAEALFKKMSKDGIISMAAFCKKVESLEGLGIQKEHAMLVGKHLEAGGISQRTFLNFIQLYYTVVKDIALTDNFDISNCKSLRKLEKDELLVVLKGPQKEEKLGVARVFVKSILDGMEGWVSVQGNQGTNFIEEIPKPFYTVTRKDATLDKEVKVEGGAVRDLQEAEILELIEGPQKVVVPDALRARVKATKDNAQGWVTIRDRAGVTHAEANAKLFVCKSSVAMTDSESISDSKVIRKLAEGEKFEATGDVVQDTLAGISRVQGKAVKDGKEGWITIKGNAGTIFADVVAKYYSVLKEVELQKSQQAAGGAVRNLEVGETFQVLDGPKEEKTAPEIRIKVRATTDKAVGWITKSKAKTWSANYKVMVATALEDTRGATEVTKTIRELAKGEQVEYIDGPFLEDKSIRMKARAKKDGTVGWVTLKDEKGQRRLDC